MYNTRFPTLSVAAGKGGTGKTLIATSLALALHDRFPGQVQLLDCDVEAPNAHLLLRPALARNKTVTLPVPQVDKVRCSGCGKCAEACQYHAIAVFRETVLVFPELCNGCGACQFICPTRAISEEARGIGDVSGGDTPEGISLWMGKVDIGVMRSGPVIRAVQQHADPDKIVVIDAPPGTACPMQEAIGPSDYCILVTEPTPFGLSDLAAAVETCAALKIPCGVILNRDGPTDPGIEAYCRRADIPLLLRIPQQWEIARAYSKGVTLAAAMPEWKDALIQVYAAIQTKGR